MTGQNTYKMKANFLINQFKKREDKSKNKLAGLERKTILLSIRATSSIVTVAMFLLTGSWKDLIEVC